MGEDFTLHTYTLSWKQNHLHFQQTREI